MSAQCSALHCTITKNVVRKYGFLVPYPNDLCVELDQTYVLKKNKGFTYFIGVVKSKKIVLSLNSKEVLLFRSQLFQNSPKFTDYGHKKAKSLILCGPNSNPNPK